MIGKSTGSRYTAQKVLYCQTVSVLVLLNVSPSELVVDERERRLQRRREGERAHHDSETVEQRDERLRKWQMRDRARRATQTVQQRESCVQQSSLVPRPLPRGEAWYKR